jgi:glycosyltransferase involved in cell wall biosynthesis
MRVAIFSDTFLPQINGVTKTLAKLKDYMDKQGIGYKFFVPGEGVAAEPSGNVISFNSWNFFLYPECKIALPRYGGVKAALDEFQPELIHLVTPFSVGLMGLKYARDNNIPVVSSYHTNFTDYLKYYKLQMLESVCWRYFRWFHSFCRVNYCPSRDTLIKLQEKGINNLAIWGRGIDATKFSPEFRSQELRRRYTTGNELLLIYVGRIAAEKEIDVLLNAVALLNKKQLAFKLVVVGDGPERSQLEAEHIPNVIFTGYQFGRELQQLYATADIFVFPSSYETYGNVILEAMSSGLPVVGAYAGGVKENLMDMDNGLAFTSGSSEEMAEKIAQLLTDDQLRISLAKNAKRHAMTRDWDEVFLTLFKSYQGVIDEHSSGSNSLSA